MVDVKGKTPLLTESEVERLYPNEWVTMQVVTRNRNGYMRKGRMIAHGPTREDSFRGPGEWPDRHPGAGTAHFFTGPLMATDDAVLIDLWALPAEDGPAGNGEPA